MDNVKKPSAVKLILLTPIFILLSHYLAVFIHEYALSFIALMLGYKNRPFDLNYGGTSLSNLLLLSNIDQNVNKKWIYASGHPGRASLMILCVLILFGYCGLAGFVNHGEISHFISATSIFAIPGIIYLLWPTRKWVKEQLKEFKEIAANGAPNHENE